MAKRYVKFTGELDEGKLSRPVRWEAVGKVPCTHRMCGNSLAAYPTTSEFDGEDIFFGLVSGFELELGYFSLYEMQAVRGPWGLPIERDLHFKPTMLKELMEEHMQKRRELKIEQAKRYAAELAQWDQRIIEIVAVGSLAENKKLDLVCTFDPEPAGDATGFFWVANLLARDDHEQLSQRIGLAHSVDLGFRIGEDIYLPGGEIVRESGEQTRLWPL